MQEVDDGKFSEICEFLREKVYDIMEQTSFEVTFSVLAMVLMEKIKNEKYPKEFLLYYFDHIWEKMD